LAGSREVLPVRRVRTCDWPSRLCAMISCMGLLSGSRAQPRSREAEMTEPGAVLEAAHTAIADLAAVLVAVRSGLGGESVPAGRHLEMGEIDLLSARDAVEKARLETDLAGPTVAGVRVTVPLSVGSIVAAERGTREHFRHRRRGGAIPVAGPASGWDAAARVPGTRPGESCSRYTTSRRVPCSWREQIRAEPGRPRAALERALICGGTFTPVGDGAAVISRFRYARCGCVTTGRDAAPRSPERATGPVTSADC